ncbi:unnamed protein product [Schistosoma mattheei]|uniref:Uncharacterized protein n=1 Tax=Schistosoma mattheei TaxID=31246 RepID=A0A183Q680_9TREM|nr:unnamed protein product [Schistosoma mattheei]
MNEALIANLTPVSHRGRTYAAADQHSPSNSVLGNPSQLPFILVMSASDSRHSVFFGLPLLRLPSGFQVGACFMMRFDDFRNVHPFHFQRLSLISS